MRVALALILLISLATAFKLEKELPVTEYDVQKQDEGNERDERNEDEGNSKVIGQFTIYSWDIKLVWYALTNKLLFLTST